MNLYWGKQRAHKAASAQQLAADRKANQRGRSSAYRYVWYAPVKVFGPLWKVVEK